MFLGIFNVDEYVPIPVVTHRFSTGAAYAPTSVTYSIYEEGNTTGLDEDVDMTPASPFDSVVGAYYARRQLTAAAGFEAGKTYVVIVKATVDSVAAIDMHVFQMRVLQTGDAYARLGSPAGASVSADVAAIKTVVDTVQADTDLLDDAAGGIADIHTDIAAVKADTAAILVDTGTTLDGKLNTIDDFLDTEIAAIKAKTDNLPATPANEATLTTIAGYLDTEIAAILADTNELQTDWANGGRLDLILDTIQADTDLLDDAAGGIADIHTDIGTLQSMLTDIHGTDLPAVKTVVDGIEVHVHTTIPALIPSAADIKTAVEAAGSHLTLIKAKTDKMTYTSGDDLDVNVQKINDVTLAGDGSGTPMGAV